MVEFMYNNAKNVNTGHTAFELNCKYHLRIYFKKNIDLYSRFCSAKKLAEELKDLMVIYLQNLLHTQKLQKGAHNKGIKPQSYKLGKKV